MTGVSYLRVEFRPHVTNYCGGTGRKRIRTPNSLPCPAFLFTTNQNKNGGETHKKPILIHAQDILEGQAHGSKLTKLKRGPCKQAGDMWKLLNGPCIPCQSNVDMPASHSRISRALVVPLIFCVISYLILDFLCKIHIPSHIHDISLSYLSIIVVQSATKYLYLFAS